MADPIPHLVNLREVIPVITKYLSTDQLKKDLTNTGKGAITDPELYLEKMKTAATEAKNNMKKFVLEKDWPAEERKIEDAFKYAEDLILQKLNLTEAERDTQFVNFWNNYLHEENNVEINRMSEQNKKKLTESERIYLPIDDRNPSKGYLTLHQENDGLSCTNYRQLSDQGKAIFPEAFATTAAAKFKTHGEQGGRTQLSITNFDINKFNKFENMSGLSKALHVGLLTPTNKYKKQMTDTITALYKKGFDVKEFKYLPEDLQKQLSDERRKQNEATDAAVGKLKQQKPELEEKQKEDTQHTLEIKANK